MRQLRVLRLQYLIRAAYLRRYGLTHLKAYSSEDTYLFKSGDADPVPLIMLDSVGEELSDEAFKNSRVGAFFKADTGGFVRFF